MTTSNRLGITEMAETQNNRSVTVNEAIAKLEAGATFFAAIQVLLNAPPGSPAEGDLYVVGTAGTGVWSGHNKNVAIYYNAAWLFFVPFEGMFAWDQTSNSLKRHDGSDWVAYTVGGGAIADGDYGDISVSSSGSAWTIDNDVVTNAKSANMATATFKGRTTAGTGDPEDLTVTQATALLNAMVGDSGSGGTKGLAPAPASGDAAAAKFLKADGTWAVPAGSGVSTGRQIISGGGLTGGGDLSADRTLAVGAGTGITVNADDVALNVNGLTEDTSPDESADFLLTYDTSASTHKKVKPDNVRLRESIIVAVGDETTAITTGTAKVIFRMPYAFTLSEVRGSLTTVSSSGIPTVNIKESGTTIFSTKLTIDASEKTSTTAATPAVISDAALADDAEITIDIDVAGTGATGLKVYLIGVRA